MAAIQQNEQQDKGYGYLTRMLAWILWLAFAAMGTHAQETSSAKTSGSSFQSKHQGGNAGYVRPNFHERLRSGLASTFGQVQMGKVVFGAAISHADDAPPDWGQGWGAYGERVASHFGSALFAGGANFVLGEALREDTRYYPCTCKGIWPRLKHALASSVTARAGEDGHRVFSIPGAASPYAGSFAQLAWLPPRFGPKDALRTGNYNLLTSVGAKVAVEFLSPLLRKFHL
ncbi:MAG TPA: hypothetical protein VN745_08685 [Verrucomicrobiae bacterium]|nr:hypothetical protein [Verrucomicrobiae bacterium]